MSITWRPIGAATAPPCPACSAITATAIAAFERMYGFARTLGARAKQAAALDRIARAHLSRGSAARALPLLERALTLGRTSGDRRGIAACLDDLAQVELVGGPNGVPACSWGRARAWPDRLVKLLRCCLLGLQLLTLLLRRLLRLQA